MGLHAYEVHTNLGKHNIAKKDIVLKEEDPTIKMGAQERGSIIAKYPCLTITFCRMFVLKVELWKKH